MSCLRAGTALSCLLGLCWVLVAHDARAETFVFVPNFYQAGAQGPASGTLVTAPGTGGPGEEITVADIVSFDFSHTFEPGTTAVFTEADIQFITFGGLFVAPDGSGLESGGWNAVNGSDQRMRMVNNTGDLNDNYIVDQPASTSNGALGGAFGGWVRAPVAVPASSPEGLLVLALAIVALAGRAGLRRGARA
jgi:hypothetical protein